MTTVARATSALAVGSAVSGLLAYVFFVVVTRALGAEAAAPVSVLWAYWSFAGAALTFPVQHWISRSVAAHGGEGSARGSLPGVAVLSVAAALLVSLSSWVVRDLLFRSGSGWFPVLVLGVTVGSAAIGVLRGVLTARGRFAAFGAALVAENAVRVAAASVLAAGGVDEPVAYGLALLLGYGVLLAWPSTFRLGASGTGDAGPPTAFLGGASGGQLVSQLVLTGGPVLLALAGGSPAEITALFAGLALFRAPYTLALGVVAQFTARFTRLVVEHREARLRRVRRALLVGTTGASLVAAVLGGAAGPVLVRQLFGPGVILPAGLAAALAAGSTVAIANLVLTLLVLAGGRAGALAAVWVVALVPGAAWFALGAGPALDRTCAAFVVVEVAAWCGLLRASPRGSPGPSR